MSKKNFFFIVLLILSIRQIAECQTTFFKTFGDTTENHNDVGYAVVQTNDGEYVVAGEYNRYYVGAPSNHYGDVYLIKADQYGDTIWTKTFGNPDRWETAYSMDKTNDGGYIVSAYIHYPQWQLWLIRTDSEGDSLWIPFGQKDTLSELGIAYKEQTMAVLL